MNKKLISYVLAGAMALSVASVSAAAAEAKPKTVSAAGQTTFKVSASVAEAIINVTVPSTVSAVINPYGVEVETKTGTYGAQGFTSPVYTIKNNTKTSAVMVSVIPTISVTLDKTTKEPTIAIVPDDTTIATATDKTIYAIVAGAESTTNLVETTKDEDIPALSIFDATGALASGATSVVFEDASKDDKDSTHVRTDLLLIPKATANAGDATKVDYGYGQFQMGGKISDSTWTKTDKINVNLVLDIAPCATSATKGTHGGASSSSDPIDTAVTALSFTSDGTAPTADATFDAATTTYTLTGGSAGDELTFSATASTGYTVSYSSTNGNGQNKTDGSVVLKSGTNTMVVTVTDDADSTKTKTYTYTLTLA